MITYWYYVKENWNNPDRAPTDSELYRFESEHNTLAFAVSDAGEDFWSNHNGHESDWPLTFVFVDSKGNGARFLVHMETEPVFSAHWLGHTTRQQVP